MINRVIYAALEEAGGRKAYVLGRQLPQDEIKALIEEGVLSRENRFAETYPCPCGDGHLEDVRWIDGDHGEREAYVICPIAIPFERFTIDAEELRLYRINPRAVRKKQPSASKLGRNTREERRLAETNVALHLKSLLFRSLGLNSKERRALQSDLTGKALADSLGLRKNTIGEILDLKLKGRNKTPADIPQLFYVILRIDRAYRVFEECAKGQRFALETLSPKELYRRLKNHISASLKNNG